MIKTWTLFFFVAAMVANGAAQPLQGMPVLKNDSAVLAASLQYKKPSFFKRLILGKNYRNAWATPVTLPIFHLAEMGFTIKELGGGQQTKSLRLLDKKGHEWALRTIDKDVEKAFPPFLQHTIAQKVTQDMVSAAHPFAPLTIPPLAQAARVVVASPKFYFVPDDPALGAYTQLFKNTMCLLEDREPTPGNAKTANTEEFVKALLENNTTQIDETAVLRARLLDMLIGDWDRHQDQWRWGFEKAGGLRYGYAIPRDRDQAYFYSDGLLVKLAQALALKHLVGFTGNTSKLKKLNAKSWNFDWMFLNGLDGADWVRVIQTFTAALPDSVIREAVKKMPPEVYPLYGPQIEKKLIGRRNSLEKDALRYQHFLSTYVTITGTDAPERFVISSTKDSLTVRQFAGSGFSTLVYDRTFYRNQTYQVTLLGLDGADEFINNIPGTTRIRLVVDGGKGQNIYKIVKGCKRKFHDSEMDAKSYLNVVKKKLRIKE